MHTTRFSDYLGGGSVQPPYMHTPLEADSHVGRPPCRPLWICPPLNRLTDASEKITLPQFLFAGGTNQYFYY